MNQILDKIIVEKNLSWDKSLENDPSMFLANLNLQTIEKLNEYKSKLNELKLTEIGFLKDEILKLKNDFFTNGCGFFVIQGSCLDSFSDDEKKKIFSLICNILGDLLIQNVKNEQFVEIKDEGKSMKTGGRYHQTKDGGSFHTDSPQWKNVPDYVGMLCLNPAKKGGISKFLSAYKIHNKLLPNLNLLKPLYENFHFDKRGEFEDGESPTVFEPIFEYKNGKLNLRYLRDYVEGGHKIQNEPLSEIQKDSLDNLDGILKNEELIVSYVLRKGDIVFFDNHRVLHGRNKFEDYDNNDLKRYLIRAWIKDKES